jgi:hypothetical protein
MCNSLWSGWGCLRERDFLFKGGLSLEISQVRSEGKMAAADL